MRRMTSVRSFLLVLIPFSLASCGAAEQVARVPPPGEVPPAYAERFGMSPRDVVRVVHDAGRGRIWVLRAPNHVSVHDAAGGRLLREIALPHWFAVEAIISGVLCRPTLLIDERGSAYVASNVQTKLWRIDGASFALAEHELTLRGREQWDLGFGALGFTRGGALYALSADGATLWNLDLVANAGYLLESYGASPQRCELHGDYLDRFERRRLVRMPPAG